MAVAFDMMFGVCGSGAYTSECQTILPTYFRYRDIIGDYDRLDYSAEDWFALFQTELNAGRPIIFTMTSHAVIADGWKIESGYNQYHMNYGWGGLKNAWYVVDSYHCPASEGCSVAHEDMYLPIEPEYRAMLYSDVAMGAIPLEVNFTGTSNLSVVTWDWDYGDGFYGTGQNPIHTFETPGIYDIGLTVDDGSEVFAMTATNFIAALADTLRCPDEDVPPGAIIEIPIYARNTVPLSFIEIPITYSGDVDLEYVSNSFTVEGCRTDYFEWTEIVSQSSSQKRMMLQFMPSIFENNPDLEPGEGPIAKLSFEVVGGVRNAQTTISMDGYFSYTPIFDGKYGEFTPACRNSVITRAYLCGDVDGNDIVDLLDIVFMIDNKFKEGDPPDPVEAADVNNDGTFDILDIVHMIDFKFKECPPGAGEGTCPPPDCGQ
jgi:PKD repeat protein